MHKVRSVLFLVGGQAVNYIIAFVSTPFFLTWIGREGYGTYLFVNSVVPYVGLLDVGFYAGANQRMIEKHRLGDTPAFWSMWWTNMLLALGVGVLGLGLFVLFSPILISVLGSPMKARFDLGSLTFYTGIQFLVTKLTSAAALAFSARGQFPMIATLNSVGTFITSSSSLALVYFFRTPISLIIGSILGLGMNLLLILYALRKDLIEMRNALFFKVEDAKNFAFFGLRQYPAMLSSILATTSDRVLLGIFGKPAKLSDYGVSNKIPETLRYLVLPITYPMLPDLTHAFQEGKAALESRFKHDTLIALAAGCAGIMIPCAMSRPVLMLWLGRHTPTEAPLVSAFMGVYCALEIYYAALVAATYAADKPQLCIPFSTWNGLATAGFTVPAYLFFGIQGVGALNMMINLVQFVPLIWWVRRGVGLQEWMRAYMGVAIKTLLLSAVFSLTGFFLAHLLSERGYIWVGVLLIPIWCVLFTVVVLYFRLAYLPESIRMAAEKILSAFKDRFRKNSSEKAPVA